MEIKSTFMKIYKGISYILYNYKLYNLRPYLGNIFLVTITCIYEWFIFTKIYIFKKQATLSFHLGIINLRKNENTKILRMLNLF